MPPLLEVCVDSVGGVIAAQRGGAQRVELCVGLVEGGLTPSPGLLRLARERADLPIMCMVRPRGGDFCYDDDELEVMARDVAMARECGAHGVVLGILHPDGTIDAERMKALIDRARPLAVTCHRAFDMTRDPREALDVLLELGVDRVLTSGHEKTAILGQPLIRELIKTAGARLVVMPGGGLNEHNLRDFLVYSGASEVHFTAFRDVESAMRYRNPRCVMGATAVPREYQRNITDVDKIARMTAAAAGTAR